jgi:hypothetical protein
MIEQAFALKRIPYDSRKSLATQFETLADARIETSDNPSWMGMMNVALGVLVRNPGLAREIMEKAEGPRYDWRPGGVVEFTGGPALQFA